MKDYGITFDYTSIFELLKKKNISLYSLRCDKLISESTLQNMRNKNTVQLTTIQKLADILGITLQETIQLIKVDKPN